MNVLHSQPDRTPAMTRHSPHKQTIIIIHSGTFQLIARFVRIRNLSYSDTVYVGSGNKIFVLYFDMMMQEDDE